MLIEKTLSSEIIYRGKIINVRVDQVILPSGHRSEREVVEHRGAVAVVPVSDKNEIILVRQYRYPAKSLLLEIPAGKIEINEEPADCAIRELQEETGLVAAEMKKMFQFYTTPGFTNERMTLFLARGLTKVESNPDEDEFLQIQSVPLQKALHMVAQGEICDAKTILGILAAEREISYK